MSGQKFSAFVSLSCYLAPLSEIQLNHRGYFYNSSSVCEHRFSKHKVSLTSAVEVTKQEETPPDLHYTPV